MVRIFWPESRLKFEFDYRVVMTIKGKSEFTTLENNDLASPRASNIQMQRPSPDDRALGVHAFVPLDFGQAILRF